jgi:hypothetical protein
VIARNFHTGIAWNLRIDARDRVATRGRLRLTITRLDATKRRSSAPCDATGRIERGGRKPHRLMIQNLWRRQSVRWFGPWDDQELAKAASGILPKQKVCGALAAESGLGPANRTRVMTRCQRTRHDSLDRRLHDARESRGQKRSGLSSGCRLRADCRWNYWLSFSLQTTETCLSASSRVLNDSGPSCSQVVSFGRLSTTLHCLLVFS